MTTPHDPTRSFSPVDSIIAGYLEALEAGQAPDHQALLARHPEYAADLRVFLEDFDRMNRVSAPLQAIDETLGLDASPAPSPLPPARTVQYFGDYELIEEIARGGMGIVYKARQVSLNRVIALKMVLTGVFASPRELMRFRAEAEAAANLDHPRIVPIYEVGEHAGQQYFSMKLVEGPSLAKHPRGPVRAEVVSLVAVARAVHHAHQHGVLHRDLKPSNVLVDPAGDLFVTDFGLAKRLSDPNASLTETGQMLGTPRYMAPEQAAGRKDLTVAADVYSLGVILYERLTGQTPFTTENVMTLLRQVRETEPPRPSTILPGLDRDLETVVLKCLEKEPARRYQSAEALALELENWLDGRPIAARPVGQAERAWRWCKRNPAVSSLTAGVAAALLLVAVVSTVFAIRDRARADAERRQRIRAEDAEQATEKTFARSLARPLDPKGDQDGHESLTSPETLALWELARLQDQPVALRFLDEATRPPVALAQLRSRSEPALIAAIGLDPARREKAASLLRERLHDDKLSTSDKVELATIALELHDQPSETLDECVRTIIEARRIKPEVRLGPDWQAHVSRASRLYEPRAVSRILLAELDRPTISYVRITEDLEPLFDRLSRAELETFRRSLVERVIAKRIELGVEMRSPLLADRLNSAESAAILQSWIEDVKRQEESKKKTPGNPPFPTRVYLWARLDAADSARILEQLLDQCDLDSWLFGNMQQVVVEAFNRLNPVDSERLSTKLMEVLAAKLETKMDEKDLNHINGFLGMIGRGLNLSTPRTGWRPSILALNRAIDRQPKVEDRAKLAWGIGPMADRLGPEEAANVCLPFAEVLRTSLEQNSVGAVDDKAFPLIQSLAAMALRLPPDQAAKLIRLLAIRAADAVPANFQASSNFYFLLAGLSEDDARQAARVIVSALNGEKDSKIRWALGAGLCVVAERMKPAEALEICGPVANQMADSFLLMKEHKFYLVNSLGVVTSRLPESQRREIVQTLLNSLEKTTDFPDFHWVVSAITASIGPGDTIDAARLARIIGPLLARESDSDLRSSYVLELGKLADRAPVLELKTILVTALEQERDPDVRVALANSLITLAGRVPAAELGAVLVALHEREPNAQLRESIIAVILKMTPTDAAALSTRMARGLVRSFEHKETDEQSLQQRLDIIKFTEKMPARESEPLCAGVIARNLKARGMELDDGGGVLTIDASVPTLLAEIRPDSAHVIARELADVFFEDSETFPGNMSETFTIFQSLLTDTSRAERALRPVAPASTTKPPATSAPATTPPYPCRLTTQELVDLLKMPTCFGMVRDLILNQLANRYGRKFASHWEFVRFAREQKLDLDFTTPPRRPDPKASLRRVLDVLDGLQRP